MADQVKTRFFRSLVPGLSIQLAAAQEGEVAPETVRFVPYRYISDMGEDLYFGYLKSNDPRALAILEKDSNVTEIEEDDFKKYTDVKSEKIARVGL